MGLLHAHFRFERPFLPRLRNFGHGRFGQQQHARDRNGVLSAMRTTLVGSMMPASTRSTYSLRPASKPKLPLPSSMRATTTPPSTAEFSAIWRVGTSSARLQDLDAGPFVALAPLLFVGYGVDAAQQGKAAARHDAFRDRRLGRADRVVERLLLRFHLRLGRRPDPDDGHAAGELGQPLLQLFAIIVARRLVDLAADLLDAAVDRLCDRRRRR